MIKIQTKYYGEIEVPEDNEIHFIRQIFGFEEYSDFYLLEMKDLDNFFWLQSKDEGSLAFVVVNPRIFKPDYVLDIDQSDKNLLQADADEDLADLVIVNIPENPSNMTLNLLGPVVINTKKRIAVQAISNRNDYETKYRVFPEEQETKEKLG